MQIDLQDDTLFQIKQATRQLVKSNGGLLPTSNDLGVSSQAIAAYYSMNDDFMGRSMPVHRFVELTAISGDFGPLQKVVGTVGKMLTDIPTGEAGHQAQKIQSAIKEMAEAIAAASDNCAREKKLKELREAGSAIADLIASLEAEPSNVTRIAGE